MRFWSEFIWLLRRIETVRTALITQINNTVNAEATARQDADSTLQGNINAEATARSNSDITLQNNINAEATARSNADAVLDKKIDNKIYVQAGTPTTSASDPIPTDAVWFKVVS